MDTYTVIVCIVNFAILMWFGYRQYKYRKAVLINKSVKKALQTLGAFAKHLPPDFDGKMKQRLFKELEDYGDVNSFMFRPGLNGYCDLYPGLEQKFSDSVLHYQMEFDILAKARLEGHSANSAREGITNDD